MITLEQLKAKLAAGRISRRGFMEGALALGATVAGAKLMMGEALAATPKKGLLYLQHQLLCNIRHQVLQVRLEAKSMKGHNHCC